MKKMFTQVAVLMAALVVMVSCGEKTDAEQVKEVATTYVKASVSGDFAALKQCVTPEVANQIKALEDQLAALPAELKAATDAARKEMMAGMPEITLGEATIDGDKAVIACTTEHPLLQGLQSISLVKVDGKWLVGAAAVEQEEVATPNAEEANQEGAENAEQQADEATKEPAKEGANE